MTKTSILMLAVAVALGIAGTSVAKANSGALDHMTVTGRTTQPIGHYEYCKVFGSDCDIRSSDNRPVKLTKARWNELVQINDQVNRAVKPATDLEIYDVEELWTYPETYGDCEDYVLLKRHMLMQRGWPASALLITVVRQSNGDGHAVLTVRTDRADFVLDNLETSVRPWHATEYQYLKRQATAYSGRWEGIDDTRATIVGSVR